MTSDQTPEARIQSVLDVIDDGETRKHVRNRLEALAADLADKATLREERQRQDRLHASFLRRTEGVRPEDFSDWVDSICESMKVGRDDDSPGERILTYLTPEEHAKQKADLALAAAVRESGKWFRHGDEHDDPGGYCRRCQQFDEALRLDLDGKPFCPTDFAQRYHAIGECDCCNEALR